MSLCLIRCLRKRKVFSTSRAHCRIWYYYLAIIEWPRITPSEIYRILYILRKPNSIALLFIQNIFKPLREKIELFSFFFSVKFWESSEHVLQLLRRRSENWTMYQRPQLLRTIAIVLYGWICVRSYIWTSEKDKKTAPKPAQYSLINLLYQMNYVLITSPRGFPLILSFLN